MKVKIDKNGILSIWRKNKWKRQQCRFGGIDPRRDCYWLCGDDCPLFKEPRIEGPFVELELCKTSYCIREEDFIDEREVSK